MQRIGEPSLIKSLLQDYSRYKNWIKIAIVLFAFASVIIGTANPQIGSRLEEAKREGIDVIIALDISNSMLAEDVKPSRLEFAKQSISKLVDRLQNDRIGLIIFAGDAFIQLPLTTDFSAAKLFLSVIEPDLIQVQGTAIGQAIDIAVKNYSFDDKVKKALIVISDGENHEDDALGSAKKAMKAGFVVNTIGIGSTQGSPIPLYTNNQRTGFMKDKDGSLVTTRMNPEMLSQIASAGNGSFLAAGNTDPDLSKLIDKLAGIDKKEYKSKLFTDYEDRFQYLFGVALLLIIFELIISERNNKLMQMLNKFVESRSLIAK
jgi:Ca-activated chloride channel family protein